MRPLMRCFSSTPSSAQSLNFVVITGSTRTSGPPHPVLGPRVERYLVEQLEGRGNSVTVIHPKEFPLLEKPQFCYGPGKAPTLLQDTLQILQQADGYLCVTPEYNHAPSPGLVNILNHFGSSIFSFKPSAIASYSAGQWGGTRAAIGLRPILSELGCLPVSAMIHVPKAHEVMDADGVVSEDPDQWESYCGRCFSQLEWWAAATKEHRQKVDPFQKSPSFAKTPSQRNAP
eukprot:Nitzschia sp. Nitz4//scaffold121_size67750//36699//37388//NITZ4_006069-RA/size67750-processed-gene-0.9-mRNA-1//1//CDS//3329534354//6379//frame0